MVGVFFYAELALNFLNILFLPIFTISIWYLANMHDYSLKDSVMSIKINTELNLKKNHNDWKSYWNGTNWVSLISRFRLNLTGHQHLHLHNYKNTMKSILYFFNK